MDCGPKLERAAGWLDPLESRLERLPEAKNGVLSILNMGGRVQDMILENLANAYDDGEYFLPTFAPLLQTFNHFCPLLANVKPVLPPFLWILTCFGHVWADYCCLQVFGHIWPILPTFLTFFFYKFWPWSATFVIFSNYKNHFWPLCSF